MNKKTKILIISIITLLILALLFFRIERKQFDGEKALEFVNDQVSFGFRTPGSEAHAQTIDFIRTNLQKNNWNVEIQEETIDNGYTIQNIIGKREVNQGPWIILAAHYDSRFVSDQDPDPGKRTLPVHGANDGASGVGVLLELSRVIPKNLNKNVWLVFFDAEDQGNIENWDWILGSRSFVKQLTGKPEKVVVIDMIGDADLNLYYEHNSDTVLSEEIWNVANKNGFGKSFIPQYKFRILDDHIPFVEAGIKAIDIIDFDYPYWHTQNDTVDKVSANSLNAVGKTLLEWLLIP